jgi:hypothetical protein
MALTTRPEKQCEFGGTCTEAMCPFAHPNPMESGLAGTKMKVCRYGSKCTKRKCAFAHASPASLSKKTVKVETQNATNSQQESTLSLLQNFQNMFKVQGKLIDELASSLADITCKVAIIFVDLDNVPRFFERITPKMISQLHYETFIICSANSFREKSFPCKSSGKVHFSLANMTKDAADAICTVAAAKLDSLLVQCGRQSDVPLIIVSDDKIFSQVPTLT